MLRRTFYFFFFLSTLFFSINIFAQVKVVPIGDRKLNIGEKISQGRVSSIVEDTSGIIWIGTLDGLNSFDGYNVSVYRHLSDDSTSISNNIINSLDSDKDGNIWVGTNNGLNRVSLPYGNFTTYFEKNEVLIKLNANKINKIKFCDNGIIWMATAGTGIVKFNTKINERDYVSLRLDSIKKLNQNMICMAVDGDGNVWFANTSSEIGRINVSDDSFELFEIKGEDCGFSDDLRINLISKDNNNRIWFSLSGLYEGLYYFDESRNEIVEELRINNQMRIDEYISSLRTISSIVNDQEGNLWMSSIYQGIFKVDSGFHITYYPNYINRLQISDQIVEDGTRTLYFSKTATLWIGLNGYGLNYINNFDFLFNTIRKNKRNKEFVTKSIRAFEEDEKYIWIGGYYGLVRLDKKTKQIKAYLVGQSIYSISKNLNDKNTLFIGLEGNGLRIFNKKTSKFAEKFRLLTVNNKVIGINVYELSNQGDSILWIGRNSGLEKLNYSTGKSEYIRFDYVDGLGSIPAQSILSSFIDDHGDAWFGSQFEGLWLYNPLKDILINKKLKLQAGVQQPLRINSILRDSRDYLWLSTDIGIFSSKSIEDEFKNYTVNDGLPNDFVYAALEDDNGDMWFSTNNGLSKWSYSDSTFTNYGIRSGIQNEEFNTGAYFKDSQGYLYFGGIDGITYFKPIEETIKEISYPLIITNMMTNYGDVYKKDNVLKLKNKTEFLSIEFSLLSFLNKEQNIYQYRNLSSGGDWINLGNANKIILNKPTVRKQLIEIRACIAGKNWNKQTLKLIIEKDPKFWQTWYFWLVFGLILVLISVLLVRRKVWINKQEKKKLSMLVNVKTRELEEINKELLESNVTKDRLFSIIAHDLRNPLNSLLGFSSLLETQSEYFSEEEKKEFVSIIHMSSKNLNNLLDNLLNWSRLQMNKIKPSFQMLEVKSVIDSNLSFLNVNIKQKKINIKTEGLSDVRVFADPDMLSVIVRNLLSNAIKFTHEHGKIKISLERESDYYKLSILDNGVGMKKETVDSLFNVDDNNSIQGTNNEVGTGLGLLLCHDFAILNKGRLEVTSTFGSGSCFSLFLKVDKE